MVNLKEFYDKQVYKLSPQDYLKQVGHSVNGKPISEGEVNYIVESIINGLKLTSEDDLLDLCCGNGVITKELSKHCGSIRGVDWSEQLVKVARSVHQEDNIKYYCEDIFSQYLYTNEVFCFNKILMFGSLQHFDSQALKKLLVHLKSTNITSFVLFIGFIPEKEKKWAFYNTTIKRALYVYRRITRSDVMGSWWSRKMIKNIGLEVGLDVSFQEISPQRYGSSYRFHAVIRKN